MTRRRIGLVADTHIPEAGPDLPAAAYVALRGCDRVLHCGDLHTIDVVDRLERVAPTVVSRGNGDSLKPRVRRPGVPEDPRISEIVLLDVGGLLIGMTHDLAHLEMRPDDEVRALLDRRFGSRVDIAVYGHTHVPLVRGLEDGTAMINPGSPSSPYGYDGRVGTLGLLDVEDGAFEVRILDLLTGETQLRMSGPGPHPTTRGPRPGR